MTTTAGPATGHHPGAGRTPSPGTVVRRLPFTLTVLILMLGLGLWTTALWVPLAESGWLERLGYGLPALQDGRWWTPVTGSLLAMTPAQYLPVAGGAAVMVGWSEWRLGTGRVAVAAVGLQLLGVLGAAATLAVLAPTGWDWAVRTATELDAGFSAGALGAVAAASATLTPPWRGRLRLLLTLYVVVAFLYIGLLWDLEHLLAVLGGLALGPVLLGRRPALRLPRFTRHEWRIVAAATFVFSAAARLVVYFVDVQGPLGATAQDSSATSALVGAGISLVLANGLRRGSRLAWRWAMAGVILVVGLLVVLLAAEIAAPDVLAADETTVVSAVPALVVDGLLWLVQAAVLIGGRSAFRAARPRRRRPGVGTAANDRETAVALLREHGGTTMSWMGTWAENSWFLVGDEAGAPAGYVAYQVHRGVAIALGDPVAADPASRARVLERFVDAQDAAGRVPCLFSVTDEVAAWGRTRAMRSVLVAEEAIIDLPDLEFRGKAWQHVRSALNRAGREGIAYEQGRLADMPRGVIAQVRAISELWVSDKGLPEMGFTLGGIDEALDPDVTVGIAVDEERTVHGITSWLPVYAPGGHVRGWTLDVMRRLPDGFKPVTEFLIANACLSFKEAGAQLVSLSGAPLAHAGDDPAAQAPLDRLLDGLGAALEPLYGFRSLESFKAKFQPRQEPVHLVFPDESALPRIGLALTAAYLPGASMRDLARAGLDARRGHD